MRVCVTKIRDGEECITKQELEQETTKSTHSQYTPANPGQQCYMGHKRQSLIQAAVCMLVTSTRLHAQKHLWHHQSESSPAAAQEDAQQHTARTLKDTAKQKQSQRHRARAHNTSRNRNRETTTCWRTPSQRPPGTAHHCVRAKDNPGTRTCVFV